MVDKISADDKTQLETKINETISWIESNQDTEVEEFEVCQKKLEGVTMTIMTKLYDDMGRMSDMGGMGGTPPNTTTLVDLTLRRLTS